MLTTVILALQLLLLRRQDDSIREQTEIIHSQQEISVREMHLTILERALTLWEKMGQGADLELLFNAFPRSFPCRPLLDSSQNEEALFIAQRVVLLKRAFQYPPEGVQPEILLDSARRLTGYLSDLAELIEWDLIELTPVLQKWHVAIIQRTWILEPYIYMRNTGTQHRFGMRAMRLGLLARLYNDINPAHRTNVIRISAPASMTGWPKQFQYSGVVYNSALSPFGRPAPTGRTALGQVELPPGFTSLDVKVQQNLFIDNMAEIVGKLLQFDDDELMKSCEA